MYGTRDRRSAGRASARLAAGAALAVLLLTVEMPASADCTAPSLLSPQIRAGDLIQLRPTRGVSKRLLVQAIAVWERCPNYGVDFPAFIIEGHPRPDGLPARVLTVKRHWRSDSSTCGRFRGSEIQVYASAVGPQGAAQDCGSPVLILAHELGHALGLPDVYPDVRCQERIMAELHGGNGFRRWVHEAECAAVGRRWLTASEQRLASARAK